MPNATCPVNVPALWLDCFPFPKREGNKYTRGHALICGGAVMTGATRLASRAAQRIGAGVVTLAAPMAAASIYAEALESVIVHPIKGLDDWHDLVNDPKKTALLVGPGLGLGDEYKEYVLAALATGKPCVVDADAITNFADAPDQLFVKLHPSCVLTPHEGEFFRLFGQQIDAHADKLIRVRQASEISKSIVLLKGADTFIADPEGHVMVNTNAPPWLATAGAGDVLAGMILGLMVQKMPLFMATGAAAWLHGKIAADFGLGLIAEDLILGIPKALKDLSAAASIV